MNTRIVMTASAVALGSIGCILSFLPQEVAETVAFETDPIVLQVLGALYIGFAMIDWMSKDSIIGGIYGKPIAIGNFTHFLVGALALIKFSMKGTEPNAMWAVAIVYSIFAVLFGYVSFTHPKLKRAK